MIDVEFVRDKKKCVYPCDTYEEAQVKLEELKKDNSIDRAKIVGTGKIWFRRIKDEEWIYGNGN